MERALCRLLGPVSGSNCQLVRIAHRRGVNLLFHSFSLATRISVIVRTFHPSTFSSLTDWPFFLDHLLSDARFFFLSNANRAQLHYPVTIRSIRPINDCSIISRGAICDIPASPLIVQRGDIEARMKDLIKNSFRAATQDFTKVIFALLSFLCFAPELIDLFLGELTH